MEKIAMFDAKSYDKESFEKYNQKYDFLFFESKLEERTVSLAKGCKGVCAFVNDDIGEKTIERLYEMGVEVIAMRCAGYSNVDFKKAYGKINVVRVPAYSPHAVAEHTMGLLLSINRKIHKAYNRTREFNFSLSGLTGMDLYGKTAGIIGTGKIGRTFIELCQGFGMKVLAYDPYPIKDANFEYVELDELLKKSHVISLHCPLTEDTKHILNREAFQMMQKGVFLLNTSRGALIDSTALLEALNNKTIAGAGLDVYEEEAHYFFRDLSDRVVQDETLALLITKPNVIVTSHQAFLTKEALDNIAETTVKNLDEFFGGEYLSNEVCYQCETGKVSENCRSKRKERCF